MKIHRFITNVHVQHGEIVIDDAELVKQIKSVLKLKVGEQVILGDGNLHEFLGEISEIGKSVVLKVLQERINENEPKHSVVLYCSILKRENFELVVQKATEVGVKEIFPLITSRTVKLDIKMDRLRKIIREAAEQSGRGIVPTLRKPTEFKDAIEQAMGSNLLFDASGEPAEFNGQDCNVFIGPEGGWEPKEIEMAKEKGFNILSLGKLTLRAETAAMIATYAASL